jgi:hypothetical protein
MEQIDDRVTVRWRYFAAVILLSVLVALLRVDELAGDPEIYRARMALLFNGRVPYVEFYFEHLPLAVIPMAFVWSLGGAFGEAGFTVLFACLMALCLGLSLRVIERIGADLLAVRAGSSWLAIAAPLFPIVLFRYDPLSLLLTVCALWAFVNDRDASGFWLTVAGILTKGWSVVLALTEWWRGRRGHAVALLAFAILSLVLFLSLPGFASARAFTGIHSETLVGGAFTLARFIAGESLQLVNDAGATYVTVPAWATLANVLLGLAILVVTLLRTSGEFRWIRGIELLSASTVAILIASPLLSPQFLLWPTPFLAFHPVPILRRLAVATTALTLFYMLGWNPGFEGSLWWVGVLNVRNLCLVALGVLAAWAIGKSG